MNVGIDFDGVIANTPKLEADLTKKIYNKSIPVGMFSKKFVISSKLLTLDQYNNIEKSVLYSEHIGLNVEEVLGAIEAIKEFKKRGILVKIYSDREEGGIKIIKKWLFNNSLDIEIESANNTVKLDAYVSDDLEKLVALKALTKSLFLFIRDSNKDVETGNIIWRVKTWKELLSHLCNIADNVIHR